MANIVNFDDAKKAAHDIINKAELEKKEQKSIFEGIMKEIETIDPSLGGFEELALLLNLEDAQFEILAPVFLEELEKSFNNVNDKLTLAQSLNASGIKIEDVQDSYKNLMEELDNQMEGLLSRSKVDFLKRMLGLSYNALSDVEGVAKKIISIPIEYCNQNAQTPAYAHTSDAGMDVYALEDITIAPGETKLIPLGIKIAIPLGYEIQVRPKSGRCLKTKLRVANTPGTIDAGYRDELGVIIDNIEPFIKSGKLNPDGTLSEVEFGSSYTIGKGEKFAQLVLSEVPKASFYKVDSIANNGEDRGGGFGSSGLK